MRYIIAPLDIKDDEFKVYKYLWSKCDFKTMICEYTERNILIDIKADFSRKRLQNIFKTFIEMNLFVILEKGTKGKPSKLFINKEVLWNQIGTELEPNKNQINVENTSFEEIKEPNKNQIRTTKVPSIKEVKNKEKENIYTDIYDYYLSLKLIQHKKLTLAMKRSIDKAKKENGYTVEEMKKLLKRHKTTVIVTKGTEREVKARGLDVFFGQKVYQSTILICAEYEDGGNKEKYFKNKTEIKKEVKENLPHDFKPDWE